MQHLGHTRSALSADHLLQTPDTFVRAPLPGMRHATAIVHIAPAAGARFSQYTVEFSDGGAIAPCEAQRFLYVLDGELDVAGQTLTAGAFAYFPAGDPSEIRASSSARAALIEKSYYALADVIPPERLTGHERSVPAQLLGGDPWLEVRALLPDSPSFDFAVNTMVYRPGAGLPMVEIHVMEHGLLMLEGGGIYRLGDRWYPVAAGDFIWMAPYCPQWFGAIGKKPAKYLIYKDWNRHAQ
jgi:(S)-ureidoglycine aminohydrolase